MGNVCLIALRVSPQQKVGKADKILSKVRLSSRWMYPPEPRWKARHLTHDHVLAVLAVGGLAKDVVLEAVGDLRPGGLGGQRRRQAEGGGVGGDGRVGADGRREGRRAVADGRRAGQQRRRGGRRVGDEVRRQAGVAVGPLEEVLHALAAHEGLEGQRALQPLQLHGERKIKK